MGRKTKLTPERIEVILSSLRAGATYTIAAEAAGISPSTLYKWIETGRETGRKPYTEFASRVREAEASGALEALATIKSAIRDGDVKSAMWFLSRRHGYKPDASHSLPSSEDGSLSGSDSLDYRSMLISQISETKLTMSKAKSSGSFQAFAAMQRQLISLSQNLRALDLEEGNADAHDRMSDEQLLSEIVNSIIALPPLLRQRVESDLHSLVGSNVVAMRVK
jgi:transposase-like protein